jgi:predicted transcriptional regulator
MTQLQQIEAFVAANPGATSAVVASHLGVARNRAGAALQYLFKQGRLHREQAGTTITNVPFYVYHPPKAKPSENVVKSSDPVVKKRKAKPTNQHSLDLNALVDDLATSLADTLAQQVAVKLKDRLMHQLSTALPALTAPTPQIHAPIINAPRDRKKKVLIAGLLPQQAGMIQSEFGEVFDLSFWKDESLHALKAKAEAAEVTITFTSKLGHAAENAIKTTGTEYHRCVGGMTSLRDMLTRMYVENNQKEMH